MAGTQQSSGVRPFPTAGARSSAAWSPRPCCARRPPVSGRPHSVSPLPTANTFSSSLAGAPRPWTACRWVTSSTPRASGGARLGRAQSWCRRAALTTQPDARGAEGSPPRPFALLSGDIVHAGAAPCSPRVACRRPRAAHAVVSLGRLDGERADIYTPARRLRRSKLPH